MEKVIKRDRKQVPFDENKIKIALRKANSETKKAHRLTEAEITQIAEFIKNIDKKALNVEAIQDIIVNKLVELNRPEIVSSYIQYRYIHKLRREANTTDDAIFDLLGGTSEYWNEENKTMFGIDYDRNQYHIVDLNGDGILEIIHRTFSKSISPITSKYTIYNFVNNNLKEIGTISIIGNIPNEIYVKGNIIKFEYWPYESPKDYTKEVVYKLNI